MTWLPDLLVAGIVGAVGNAWAFREAFRIGEHLRRDGLNGPAQRANRSRLVRFTARGLMGLALGIVSVNPSPDVLLAMARVFAVLLIGVSWLELIQTRRAERDAR